MFFDLTIKAGGCLVSTRWSYDAATKTGKADQFDVSAEAATYLNDLVVVDDDVTLGDVFQLIAADKTLQRVYSRNYIQVLCEEAANGPDAWPEEFRDQALECLEMRHVIEFSSADMSYGPLDRWSLVGLEAPSPGTAMASDQAEGARRVRNIHLTPLRQMLTLPVRLNGQTLIIDTDPDTNRGSKSLPQILAPHITLGQFFHQLLHELSVYGTPAEQAKLVEKMLARARLGKGKAGLAPA